MSIHKVSSRLSVFHSEYPQRFLAATRDLCSLCWSVPSRKMSVRVVQIHISQDWRSFRILSSQKSLLASHEQHGFLFFQPFTAIGHPILFPSLVNTRPQSSFASARWFFPLPLPPVLRFCFFLLAHFLCLYLFSCGFIPLSKSKIYEISKAAFNSSLTLCSFLKLVMHFMVLVRLCCYPRLLSQIIFSR